MPGGQLPGAPRPAMRPAVAPQQPAHPQHPAQPAHAPHAPQNHGSAKIAAMPTLQPGIPAGDDGAIALIEDGEDDVTLHKKIKAFGADANTVKQTKWTRQSAAHDGAPVRVKTFHCKLSDQGTEYLDEAINHFIDEHPDVHVKFVTTNVGMFDGKFKDFALIVNLWY
jgi:hypothetical protein